MQYRNTLVTIALIGISLSVGAEPPSLTNLRESWQRARQQANAPLDKKYVDALQAMKTQFTKAGDLENAVLIDAEIKSLKESTSAASVAPATVGSSLAVGKDIEFQVEKGKESKGLKGGKWISKWAAGESVTWSKAKVTPGKYGVVIAGGGFRPFSQKMRLTIGSQTTDFVVWPNSQSAAKEKDFDVGMTLEVTTPLEGVKLECVEIEPKLANIKEDFGFLAAVKLIPIKTQ
jgi:hypothetical protein